MAIIVSDMSSCAFAYDDSVLVAWWRSAPDAASVAAWDAAVTAFIAQAPGVKIVAAVVDGVEPPDNDARAAMVALLERCSAVGAVPAVVVIGGGFKASLQRSAIATVGFLARGARPMVVADDPASLYGKLGADGQPPRFAYDAVFDAARTRAKQSGAAAARA